MSFSIESVKVYCYQNATMRQAHLIEGVFLDWDAAQYLRKCYQSNSLSLNPWEEGYNDASSAAIEFTKKAAEQTVRLTYNARHQVTYVDLSAETCTSVVCSHWCEPATHRHPWTTTVRCSA